MAACAVYNSAALQERHVLQSHWVNRRFVSLIRAKDALHHSFYLYPTYLHNERIQSVYI